MAPTDRPTFGIETRESGNTHSLWDPRDGLPEKIYILAIGYYRLKVSTVIIET